VPPPVPEEGLELLRRRGVGTGQAAFVVAQEGNQRLPDHRLEQGLLARVVEIERTLAHAGPGGNVVEPRRGVAALGELDERGGEEVARTVVLATLPARRRRGGVH